MNRDETIALWRQGKDAWNAWAEDMRRQRAELEKAGTWNGDKPGAQWSDETRKWSEAAKIDFSGLKGTGIDFNRGVIDKWYGPTAWFGMGYDFFADCGRSIWRPFVTWAGLVLAFAAFYLSQTEVMQQDLALKDAWWGSAAAQAGLYAMANTVPCYPPLKYTEIWRKNWRLWEKPKNDAAANSANSNETTVGGLSEKLRSQTNARAEALHLAFRNAFVVLDGGSDASHRMYGCLYGLEMYAGQNPVPIVPSAVSTASAIQKLISGVLIFLFGLALRNMLKVK